MRTTIMLCAAFALLFFGWQCAWAQATAAVPVKGTDSFAAEPFVIERLSRTVAMNADGTGVETQTAIIKLQSEPAVRQFSVVAVRFASASQRVEFSYVRARHPNGTSTETPLTGVQEQPDEVTREAPFYSDLKQAQLPVKNLQVGDTLEWQARLTVLKAEAPGEFWDQQNFLPGAVILADEFELSFPSSKAVQVWTNPKLHLTPEQTVSGDRRVYRWRTSSLSPTVGAAAQAEKERKEKTLLTPEEELDAKEGALPSVAWTTFPDWAAVGAWYRALEGSRAEPDDAVKAKVAELTAGKSTQEEKVRAVYSYVSTQVRYIGVALGVGRYQPHTAGAVLENQYGDCKDKHTLLAAMLTTLGLHPNAVLIGAGLRFNQAVPSPGSFNHLITQVQIDGKNIWLDSTTEVAPYQLLLPILRDKQALVVPPTAVASVERTPAALPFAPFATSVASGSLDGDLTSDSQITYTIRDDDELSLRGVLRGISAAQYDEFMQRFMAALGFGGTTSQPVIGSLDELSRPLTLSLHYHRVKEADWGTDRITAMFMPMGLPWIDDKKPPVASLQLGVPRTETSTVDLKLPPGWDVQLPDAVHAKSTYATCDVTYAFAGGTLHEERKVVVLKPSVLATDWKQYKKWYDEAGANGTPYIQLKPPQSKK